MNEEIQVQMLRVSPHYWRREGFIFAVLTIFSVLAIFYLDKLFYFISGYLIVVAIYKLWRNIKFISPSHISFSTAEIYGEINGSDFNILLDLIKAVSFSGSPSKRICSLFTETDHLNIPCQYFDEKILRSLLQTHLPADVLQPFAYQNLASFIKWKHDVETQFLNLSQPLKVSLGASSWGNGIIVFGGGLAMSAILYVSSKTQPTDWIWPFILCSVGLLLFLSCLGRVEATAETISVCMLFSRYNFAWRDLRKIYVSTNQGVVALIGDDCQLIVPSRVKWTGKDTERLTDLISYKLAISAIEQVENWKIYYWRSKNAPQ